MPSLIRTLFIVGLASLFIACDLVAEDWQPKKAPLMTRWAKDVSPEKVHSEYPRPQMVREKWVNLNGLWDYAIVAGPNQPQGANPGSSLAQPEKWDGKILVPFPVESALSGVMQRVPDNGKLWYRRSFTTPEMPKEGRLLLHFGAVDWETVVSVNGQKVGEHRGGYDPFTFDITDALTSTKRERVASGGENELIVAVSDPTDGSFQPRGKQVRKPHGIWYTPTTGIWQTVWLEVVPKTYIAGVEIVPNIDKKAVQFTINVRGIDAEKYRVMIHTTSEQQRQQPNLIPLPPFGPRQLEQFNGFGKPNTAVEIAFPNAKPWEPESPTLYFAGVELLPANADGTFGGRVDDSVVSYFAMRKISLGKDEHGVQRLMLNNKPLFQYGPLDQGFWPDGLYTAPTDEALRYDIEMTKKLGFNMIRKHVKVEPDRWYYHCDKLGMLVWQDMPSGDKHAQWDPFGKFDNQEATRSKESSNNFNREWKAIIDSLRNHPSIVMWVPFNEGWGQANTVAVTKWTKEYDPTRLVNCASGGNDFPVGDVIDVHRYPGPFAPKPTSDRAAVLGEFGGLGLPLEGHTWQGKDNWGYRSFTKSDDLQKAYVGLLSSLRPMIAQGVSAAVYTQTTDVEIEVNGLMTYDRAVLKMDADTIAKAARKLYLPPPRVTTLVPTSEETAQRWRIITDKPEEGWQKPDFDDSGWRSRPGGFGEPSTPGSVVKTEWKTNDIWLRREFDLKAQGITLNSLHELALRIHHDEDAEVFLNGELIAKTTGYTTQYVEVPLDEAARKLLKFGTNTLAVHCKQTGGGQYIDVGLVDVQEASR